MIIFILNNILVGYTTRIPERLESMFERVLWLASRIIITLRANLRLVLMIPIINLFLLTQYSLLSFLQTVLHCCIYLIANKLIIKEIRYELRFFILRIL